MLCKFYGWSLNEVKKLSLSQVNIFLNEMTELQADEKEKEEIPLTGKSGAKVAKRIFPKGERRPHGWK